MCCLILNCRPSTALLSASFLAVVPERISRFWTSYCLFCKTYEQWFTLWPTVTGWHAWTMNYVISNLWLDHMHEQRIYTIIKCDWITCMNSEFTRLLSVTGSYAWTMNNVITDCGWIIAAWTGYYTFINCGWLTWMNFTVINCDWMACVSPLRLTGH